MDFELPRAGIIAKTSGFLFIRCCPEIFLSKIKKIVEEYDKNYEELKTELKMPENYNFCFNLRTTEGEIEKPECKTAPSEINVYSEEVPLLYINNEADLRSGFLTIQIW